MSGKAMSERMVAVAEVHATAVLDPTVELGADVVIGPYCVVGPNVVIGDGARIGAHVVIERDTAIGAGCVVHAGAVLGGDPQDLKYGGEPSRLEIGARTVVREFVTLNRGTSARGVTEIGSDCLIMAYAHVAHNCLLGDHVILANSVNLAGHIEIGDYAIIGGVTPVHQFVKIGPHSIIGGGSRVPTDVAPYVKAAGSPIKVFGLNVIGLQRRGFSAEAQQALKRLYRIFFRSTLLKDQAVAQIREELPDLPEVRVFLDFVERSERGIAR